MRGERYDVDVKLPGIEHDDQAAANLRVKLAGLEVSLLKSTEPEKASAEVLLLRPKRGTGKTQEPKPLRPRKTKTPSKKLRGELQRLRNKAVGTAQ